MLKVKTELKQSSIEGLGLFAAEFIPAGTVTWVFDQSLDVTLAPEAVEKLDPIAKQQFLHYAYLDNRHSIYVLCFDDSRFMNHAEDPNTDGRYSVEHPFGYDQAVRDIAAGEELTCNYFNFDADVAHKFSEKT